MVSVVSQTYLFALFEDAIYCLLESPLQWFTGAVFVLYIVGIFRKLFRSMLSV